MLEHSAASLESADDAGEVVVSGDANSSILDPPSSPSPEFAINRLFESEPHHMPRPDYYGLCRDRSIDLTARQDSINWILKVHAHHHFRPVTALLSVNYFDRFLSIQPFPANVWQFQLLSVACLSLAAKMEELYVPLLLDLQIFEPKFVFEPKVIQRMEIWVSTNLNWRLRSVTPFDYLHHFISKIPSHCSQSDRLLSIATDLILSTTRVIDFLGFPPSTIAAAAVISAAGDGVDVPATAFSERVNKEMLRSCHQLMVEYMMDRCPSSTDPKAPGAEQQSEPPSPIGVIDAAAAACVSCDTRSEMNAVSAPVTSTSASGFAAAAAAAANGAEPSRKRPRSESSVADVLEED